MNYPPIINFRVLKQIALHIFFILFTVFLMIQLSKFNEKFEFNFIK